MVWNDIFNFINDNFAQLGVGGLGLLEVVKLVTNRLSFNKVFQSTVTPITSSNQVVFNKVADTIKSVAVLTKQVEDLVAVNATKDKQIETLSNLVVTTLSVANVPLTAKTSFYNNLVKTKAVADDTVSFLGKIIEAKRIQDVNSITVSDEDINALKIGV